MREDRVHLFFGGHMDTLPEVVRGRRRRRRHSEEFKARVVAQCRRPGVSIAGVALANGLNANLLRRWVVEREQGSGSGTAVTSQRTSSRTTEGEFVPVRIAADSDAHADIRIALQGRALSVEVRWPLSGSDDCARWLRALLE